MLGSTCLKMMSKKTVYVSVKSLPGEELDLDKDTYVTKALTALMPIVAPCVGDTFWVTELSRTVVVYKRNIDTDGTFYYEIMFGDKLPGLESWSEGYMYKQARAKLDKEEQEYVKQNTPCNHTGYENTFVRQTPADANGDYELTWKCANCSKEYNTPANLYQ